MKCELNTRLGCDRCKQDRPTYNYDPLVDEAPQLWFCPDCVEALLEWPWEKKESL